MKLVNLFFVVLLVALCVSAFGLQALALKLGLRWTKIAEVSIGKSLMLMLLFMVAAIPAGLALAVVEAVVGFELTGLAYYAVSIVVSLVVSGFVVAKMYDTSWKRGVKAVLPSTLMSLVFASFLLIVLRPFLYEAFVMPTNGMAPTLLGWHLEAACPDCGAPTYCSPPQDALGQSIPADEIQMICSHEMSPVVVNNFSLDVHEADRFLIAKLITPKRWDIIVFNFPGDPSVKYAQRLVGLPGEEIFIRDGAVWANGERLVPPEPIRDIQYLTTLESAPANRADESKPAKLGPDEYFVLGDFSAQSADSRVWPTGAPGHPAYAVPKSHVVGVVVNVYWPISRWCAFR